MSRRSWTFYVQGAAVVGFTAFAMAVNCWFLWRAYSLHQLGDVWVPALCFGAMIGPVFILFSGILWTLFFKLALPQRPWNAAPEELRPSERVLINPILEFPSPGVLATAGLLSAIALWAVFAWGWQLYHGLQVTGLGGPVFWGFYITNFVFFIGISHAGTLISAILRIANAEWRRSITRSAEVITVLVLMFGAGNIILDLDISKDSRGETTAAGIAINTKHIKTQVLVENGGTVVIGGIFELTETENRISVARRDYNESVQQYNTYVRTFPQAITAKVIGAKRKTPFTAPESAQQAPRVQFGQ